MMCAQDFNRNDIIIRDSEGHRLVKCKYCGKVARDDDFVVYGGRKTMNLGKCRSCAEKMRKDRC